MLLTTFPQPVYFVLSAASQWDDARLASPGNLPPIDSLSSRLRKGTDVWIAQTFIQLKRMGYPVELVSTFVPGAVCVVHYDDLVLKQQPFRSFVVVVQADRPRAAAAEMRIVQNPRGVHDPRRDILVQHWPQAGLMPRDAGRGGATARIGYFGLLRNLDRRYRSESFRAGLAGMGMELVIRENDWADYRDIDITLAVRDSDDYDLALKPASKLVNSWIAGCPAVVGREPAYQHLRTSPADFAEVATPEEAIEALRRLKEDPALYTDMVATGRRRAQEFTFDRMTEKWAEVLAGPVAERYARWRRLPGALGVLLRGPKTVARVISHRREKRRHAEMLKRRPA